MLDIFYLRLLGSPYRPHLKLHLKLVSGRRIPLRHLHTYRSGLQRKVTWLSYLFSANCQPVLAGQDNETEVITLHLFILMCVSDALQFKSYRSPIIRTARERPGSRKTKS
jgi:hypothetical protein